jgi:hypothetical protein
MPGTVPVTVPLVPVTVPLVPVTLPLAAPEPLPHPVSSIAQTIDNRTRADNLGDETMCEARWNKTRQYDFMA